MTVLNKPALLTVAVLVVTLIAAPVADARPTCQSTPFTTICETNGSVSIKARPGTVAPPVDTPQVRWSVSLGRRR